jgi:hypothetical protein
MLVHDWLLTGDPLFWVSVSHRYSDASPGAVMTPLDLLGSMLGRYLGMPVLTVLAIVGFVALVARRQWVALVGLVGASLGIAAFLELLAIRGTYVSSRYFAAIDLALIFAAAAGAAAAIEDARGLVARRWRITSRPPAGASSAIVAIAAVILAVASIWPVASLSATFRNAVETQLRLAENADRVLPPVAAELSHISEAGTFAAPDAPISDDPAQVILLVPPLESPRFAVDLDLPLTQISTVARATLVPGAGFIPHGNVIVHDALVERRDAHQRLEIDRPTQYGDVTLEPIVADPGNGVWVLRIVR